MSTRSSAGSVAPAEWEAIVRHESWMNDSGADVTALGGLTDRPDSKVSTHAEGRGRDLSAQANSIFGGVTELIEGICEAAI